MLIYCSADSRRYQCISRIKLDTSIVHINIWKNIDYFLNIHFHSYFYDEGERNDAYHKYLDVVEEFSEYNIIYYRSGKLYLIC